MFAKKNVIVIALIAIFVMGAVVLQAVNFQVEVHVAGSGWGWYKTTNYGPIYRYWNNGTNPLTVPDNLGAVFECFGSSQYGSDYDSGVLNPYEINHFYLDLTGLEQIPDPEPNND